MGLWLAAGLLFWALGFALKTEPRSRYWGSELGLYALMLVGLWANARHDLRKRIRIPRRLTSVAYVALVWTFGMLYETSLTVTRGGRRRRAPGDAALLRAGAGRLRADRDRRAGGDLADAGLVPTGAPVHPLLLNAPLRAGFREPAPWGLIYSPVANRLFQLPANP